jgi:hypothetical protein
MRKLHFSRLGIFEACIIRNNAQLTQRGKFESIARFCLPIAESRWGFAAHELELTTPSEPNIWANATHPRFIETKTSVDDIHKPYPIAGDGMSVVMALLKKDQWCGSTPTLYCATKTGKSGECIGAACYSGARE